MYLRNMHRNLMLGTSAVLSTNTDVGSFFEEETVTLDDKQTKVANAIKGMAEKEGQKENKDFTISLSLEKIYAIALEHKQDKAAAIKAVLEADAEAAEEDDEDDTDITKDISAQPLSKEVREIIERLDTNASLQQHLEEAVTIDSKRRRNTAEIAFDLSLEFSEEEIEGMVDPGSKYDDEGYGDGPNEKPYDVRKAGEGSYYGDIAKGMTRGKQLLKEYEDAMAATDAKQQTPPQYKEKPESWMEKEQATKKQAVNAFAKGVKDGFLTLKNMAKVNKITKLKAVFDTEMHGDKEVIARGNLPIKVYYLVADKKTGANIVVDRYVATSTFNKKGLIEKVALLSEPKDQVNAFVIKKGKKKGKAETGKDVVINKATDFAAAANLQATWIGNEDLKPLLIKHIATDEGPEFLDSLDTIATFAKEVLANPAQRERLNKFRTDKLNMEKKNQKQEKKAA